MIKDGPGVVQKHDIDVGATERLLELGSELGVVPEPWAVKRRGVKEDGEVDIAVGLRFSTRNRAEKVGLENFGPTFDFRAEPYDKVGCAARRRHTSSVTRPRRDGPGARAA